MLDARVEKTVVKWSQLYQEKLDRLESDKKLEYELEFRNLIFEDDVILTGNLGMEIRFTECKFKSNIIFENLELSSDISFRMSEGEPNTQLRVFNSQFKEPFNCNISNVDAIFLTDATFEQNSKIEFKETKFLKIRGLSAKNLEIVLCNYDELEPDYHYGISIDATYILGNVYISGRRSKIGHIFLDGHLKDSRLTISDFIVQIFSISNFDNLDFLRIKNIDGIGSDEERPRFEIINSNLGKTSFYNIDLKTFKKVLFEGSSFIECQFINFKWPSKIHLTTRHKKEGIKRREKQRFKTITWITKYNEDRETYRQLKIAMTKQGDYINEQYFHGKELRVYNKSLSWTRDFWTKLIINMSYWFSDFGQSFIRPIIWLFIGHTILFYFALINCEINGYTWTEIVNYRLASDNAINMYLTLLNPLRSTTERFSGLNIWIDLSMRIWSSYMIYNIIRASRRFIK